ncbi:transposable element Tcb1 transposase [Trichonephila clavipes]|nr:transposable element Tcb1 transposase [Trichonephila clavipes]
MVWDCITSHGVGRLHIVNGTVKATDYIEILQNKLLPTARDLLGNQSWIFQDDNALCHRAKVVQKWLEDHTVNRMNWPGQSPDLNPIESLWETQFGWVAGGRFQETNTNKNLSCYSLKGSDSIEEKVNHFFELQALGLKGDPLLLR